MTCPPTPTTGAGLALVRTWRPFGLALPGRGTAGTRRRAPARPRGGRRRIRSRRFGRLLGCFFGHGAPGGHPRMWSISLASSRLGSAKRCSHRPMNVRSVFWLFACRCVPLELGLDRDRVASLEHRALHRAEMTQGVDGVVVTRLGDAYPARHGQQPVAPELEAPLGIGHDLDDRLRPIRAIERPRELRRAELHRRRGNRRSPRARSPACERRERSPAESTAMTRSHAARVTAPPRRRSTGMTPACGSARGAP